jgi:hypothetical protein
MKLSKKKALATHVIGLISIGILWFIANETLYHLSDYKCTNSWNGKCHHWHKDQEGFWLLGIMVSIYFLLFWAIRTLRIREHEEE